MGAGSAAARPTTYAHRCPLRDHEGGGGGKGKDDSEGKTAREQPQTQHPQWTGCWACGSTRHIAAQCNTVHNNLPSGNDGGSPDPDNGGNNTAIVG